jgi:trimethylamine--corrinoid protein Co-methyltransferase
MKELFKWLDISEIERIHSNALHLIEEVGFKLNDEDLIKKLKPFDVEADTGSKTVKIRKEIAEYFIAKIPGDMTFFAVDPRYDLKVGEKRLYRPISGTINVLDHDDVRRPTTDDMKNISKIVQKLEFMHFNATSVIPFDVPEKTRAIAGAKACFENCSKHMLVDVLNKRDFEIILEMAFAVTGGEEEFKKRPFIQVHFPAISPLVWDENACETAKIAARYNIPMRIASSPMSGANSPIRLAGTLLLMHTEIVAGAVVTQMLNEGCPVYYGAAPTIFDMRYGTMSWGAAEHAKMAAASAGLAHHSNLFATSTGFATDSKIPDQQAAIEKSMNLILAALSGVDVLAGAGLFEGELSYDIAQLVVDNELARYVENVMRGVSVDEKTMSIDLIKKVGIGGHYLDTDQTLQFFKTEHEENVLLDRRSRDVWRETSEKSVHEKAKKVAADIIASENEYGLPDGIKGKIEEIYRRNI